jgi:hypothetical protein
MLIQHILTDEILSKVFGEDDFHRQNNVAKNLYALQSQFFTGSVKKGTLKALKSYYAAIRAAAAQISSHCDALSANHWLLTANSPGRAVEVPGVGGRAWMAIEPSRLPSSELMIGARALALLSAPTHAEPSCVSGRAAGRRGSAVGQEERDLWEEDQGRNHHQEREDEGGGAEHDVVELALGAHALDHEQVDPTGRVIIAVSIGSMIRNHSGSGRAPRSSA